MVYCFSEHTGQARLLAMCVSWMERANNLAGNSLLFFFPALRMHPLWPCTSFFPFRCIPNKTISWAHHARNGIDLSEGIALWLQ